uniref:Uncharacterized protein n=1 Tax=Arundo donax TaxID=35708 RepID=A0A0A9FQC8_ARUDO
MKRYLQRFGKLSSMLVSFQCPFSCVIMPNRRKIILSSPKLGI